MATFTVLKRGLATTAVLNTGIKNVTVIGGGVMGSGIAQVAAQSGHSVTLLEVNVERIKTAEKNIKESVSRISKKLYKDDTSGAKKFEAETLSHLKGTTKLDDAVHNSDLVIEAISENLEEKHKLFKNLDKMAPPHTLFASNSSSLSIAEIASVSKRKDKFGGLHFFHPVPVMKLLEVIRIPETSDETHEAMLKWGHAIGKACITCKDTPGFIVNRLLVPYIAEAIRMMERGDASPKDIDAAMRFGAGYPMGPFQLSDFVGHDISNTVIQEWHKKYPNNPLFEPCKSLEKLVKEGKLGMKTGEGYYQYENHKRY